MGYQLIFDDTFQRADTSYGTHGTTNTNVGTPAIFGSGQTPAAWKDVGGDYWAVKSDALSFNPANNNAGNTASTDIVSYLSAPTPNYLNQKMVVYFTTPSTITSINGGPSLFLRQVSDGSGYVTNFGISLMSIQWHNSGSEAQGPSGGTSYTHSLAGQTDSSGHLLPNTAYIATFIATSPSAGVTNLTAFLADRISGNVFATNTISGSFAGDPTVHNAGGAGIGQRSNTVIWNLVTYNEIQLYQQPTSNLNTTTNIIQGGSVGQGITLIGTGTTWQSGTAPVFTYSGATVSQVGSVQIISDTQAIVYLTVASSQNGDTLTITDPTQGSNNTTAISIVAAARQAVLIDVPFSVPDTTSTIKILFMPAHEGLAPYSLKAYRGRTSTFNPGDSGVVDVTTAISGNFITDTPPDGKIYTYLIQATDSSGTPVVAQSFAVPGIRGFAYPPAYPAFASALATPKEITIVGDSIVNYINQESGVTYLAKLETALNAVISGISYVNAGQAGANVTNFDPSSGSTPNYYNTTVLSSTSATLKASITASGSGGYASIWLGANDTSSGESKSTWKTSLQSFITNLQTDFPGIKVMCHYPYWRSSGDATVDDLVIGYADAIDELVLSNTNFYAGDKNMLVYDANRPLTDEGTHLNDLGGTALAQYHAYAFVNAFAAFTYSISPSSQSGTVGQTGPTYTVTASAAWNTSGSGNTVTITSSNGSDTVVLVGGATVLGGQHSATTFKPFDNGTSFQFAVMASGTGARTLTPSNNYSGADPSPVTYIGTAASGGGQMIGVGGCLDGNQHIGK